MEVSVTRKPLEASSNGGLVFLCYEENVKANSAVLDFLPPALRSAVSDFAGKRPNFGEKGKCHELHSRGEVPAAYLLFGGLGKAANATADILRQAGASVARHAEQLKLESLVVFLPENTLKKGEMAAAFVEGALSGIYSFTPYKSEQKQRTLNSIVFFAKTAPAAKEVAAAIAEAEAIMEGVYFARDLVSTPSNDMTPQHLADKALLLRSEDVKVSILEAQEILALGMNALHGVAKGSRNEPRLIIIEYQGGDKKEAPVVLVGKGLTFDSGGISIKPSENMGEMKTDMAGAAAVLATLATTAKLRVQRNIVGVIPALENMPDGNAYKPGDVLRSLAKITIEISNTDAEGRVALADAIAYAHRYKPELIVDIATLTGACSVAIGQELIAMMGNHESYKRALAEVATAVGEPVWELPLWEGYKELIKSDIADVVNSSGREAGTITAGLFLAKFAGDYPWLHLDIASTAWTNKNRGIFPKGATGVGVRLLTKFIQRLAVERVTK